MYVIDREVCGNKYIKNCKIEKNMVMYLILLYREGYGYISLLDFLLFIFLLYFYMDTEYISICLIDDKMDI